MSEAYSCPECKDTGVYQGLNTVEPCRACGGKRDTGQTLFGLPIIEVPGMESPTIVYGKARYVTSQPIAHELEEQVAEPITLEITLDHLASIWFSQETDQQEFGGGRIERFPIGPPCVNLDNAIFQPADHDAVMKGFYTHEIITLSIKGTMGEHKHQVRLLSFEMNPQTKRADMVFEVCDA